MLFRADRTAVIVCDLWDAHWCQAANIRLRHLAPEIEYFLSRVRKQGMLIVHSPSGTMNYYKQHPARQRACSALGEPSALQGKYIWVERDPEREPPLPIDDSDGGCGCTPVCVSKKVFTRQSPVISIEDTDVISTDEHEICAIFDAAPIERVLILGVHLNMCILGRAFGIRRWLQLNQEVLLVKDLTDVIYNPRRHPFVTHAQARDLVIAHVEAHLCPSVSKFEVLDAVAGS